MVFLHLSFFFAFTSAVTTVSGGILLGRVLHESRSTVPHGWTLHRRADSDTILPLSIALRQSNLENLDDYLLEIADPDSPKYGQLWTPARVAETFRPAPETVAVVQEWLADDGIQDASRVRLSKDGGFMHLNVTVAEAERLLMAQYYVYQHEETGAEHVGCHYGYHLPPHVARHVDVVTPTVEFGGVTLGAQVARRKRSGARAAGKPQRKFMNPVESMAEEDVPTDAEHCDQLVTLDCLRELYNFYPNLTATDKNKAGVVELADQTFVASDLDQFFKKFAPELVGTQPTLISIDGGVPDFTQTDPSIVGESDLDFELFMGLLGKQQETRLYQVGGDGSFNLLLDAIDQVTPGTFCHFDGGDDPDFDVFNSTASVEDCGDKDPAFVYSLSYAGAEDFPSFYMQRQCQEYGKLSLLGMTFLFASGDNGVASNSDGFCLAANGSTVVGEGNFLPNFPATCPYVTAVGSTQVAANASVHDREIAAAAFPSGGGFSNVFPRPKFQNRAVGGFLKNFPPQLPDGVFNKSGRAVPDVATNGFPTAVVVGGNYSISGGTSASTPIFAAMIVAVNDARLAAGKNPVGWINPVIYSNLFRSAFNDIVVGNNSGCGTDGFSTAPGWDPVTGLGTPKFPTMLSRFLALP